MEEHPARAPLAHPPAAPSPAAALRSPWALLALALLIVNDHLLKGEAPGWLTGKLSDFAGLLYFPLLLQGLWGWLWIALAHLLPRGRAQGAQQAARSQLWFIALTGLCFALIQLWPLAGDLYRRGLGLLQWPAYLLADHARAWRRGPVSVQHTADPTDLIALIALWGSLAIAQRSRGSIERQRRPSQP